MYKTQGESKHVYFQVQEKSYLILIDQKNIFMNTFQAPIKLSKVSKILNTFS